MIIPLRAEGPDALRRALQDDLPAIFDARAAECCSVKSYLVFQPF